MGIIKAVIDALTNPPETVRYPFGPLTIPRGFRGQIVIDAEKCTGCGLCVRDCPANGLDLIRESRKEYQLVHYPARCAYCGQCEDSCRQGAISHSNDLVNPGDNVDNWVVILKSQTED